MGVPPLSSSRRGPLRATLAGTRGPPPRRARRARRGNGRRAAGFTSRARGPLLALPGVLPRAGSERLHGDAAPDRDGVLRAEAPRGADDVEAGRDAELVGRLSRE